MSFGLHNSRRKWSLKKRIGLAVALAFTLLLIAFGAYASTGVFGNNAHEVAQGKFYRSAQLTQGDLDDIIARDGIRFVLSLRKFDPPAPELAAEFRHLDEIGLGHENIALSPTRLPKPEAVAALIERLDSGPYPILVHCEEGADRTGLASVVWLVLHGGKSVVEARASDLSLRTGHFAWGQAHAMDDFFDLYARTANGKGLREWMVEAYPKLYDGRAQARGTGEVLAHDRN